MKVYQHDSNKYYVGETTAYNGILPVNTVDKAPPAFPWVRTYAQWKNGTWVMVPDHRARKAVDGFAKELWQDATNYWLPEDNWKSEPRHMTTIGSLPDNALLSAPAKTLAEAKEEKLVEIKNSFDKEESEGFVTSSLGFRADATRKSKADVDGLVQAMSAMGYSTISFRDYDNKTHTLSLDQVKTLQLELVNKGLWNYQTKWDLEKKIASAPTVEAVEKIVWPSKV